MRLFCNCQNCGNTKFELEVMRDKDPYSATLLCGICMTESAFIISFDHKAKEPKVVAAVPLEEYEYMCEKCLYVYMRGRTDEEALEVAREQHKDETLTLDNTGLVCESCFKKIVIPQLN